MLINSLGLSNSLELHKMMCTITEGCGKCSVIMTLLMLFFFTDTNQPNVEKMSNIFRTSIIKLVHRSY